MPRERRVRPKAPFQSPSVLPDACSRLVLCKTDSLPRSIPPSEKCAQIKNVQNRPPVRFVLDVSVQEKFFDAERRLTIRCDAPAIFTSAGSLSAGVEWLSTLQPFKSDNSAVFPKDPQ